MIAVFVHPSVMVKINLNLTTGDHVVSLFTLIPLIAPEMIKKAPWHRQTYTDIPTHNQDKLRDTWPLPFSPIRANFEKYIATNHDQDKQPQRPER